MINMINMSKMLLQTNPISYEKLMRRLRHRVDTVYIDRGPWLERGLRDLRMGRNLTLGAIQALRN
jgi:hypothetical protein